MCLAGVVLQPPSSMDITVISPEVTRAGRPRRVTGLAQGRGKAGRGVMHKRPQQALAFSLHLLIPPPTSRPLPTSCLPRPPHMPH